MKNNILYKQWKNKLPKKKIVVIKNNYIGSIKRKTKILASLHDLLIKIKKKIVIKRFLLIRNPSVVIVPIIICKNKYYTILTKQFRIIDGKSKLEFPAGSIESKQTPKQAALDEVREELGLNLKKNQIKTLYNKYIEIETSCTSSRSYYFYFVLKKNKKFLLNLNGKICGNKEKGEHIELNVKKFSKIDIYNNTTIMIGKYLALKKLKLSATGNF